MSSVALAYALLAGAIPSFVWLAFWLHEDSRNPEPRWLVTGIFFSGALSVIVAIFAEKYIADMISTESTRYALWAAAEEIIKFTVVAAVALRSKWNDEPIDAMIYAVTVALGFAAVENTLFIFGPFSSGDLNQGLVTGSMRFVGATLVHTVSSAMVGFALGLSFYSGWISKITLGTLGLGAAIALHAAFNISIVNSGAGLMMKSFVWVWSAAVILIILFEEVKAVKQRPA